MVIWLDTGEKVFRQHTYVVSKKHLKNRTFRPYPSQDTSRLRSQIFLEFSKTSQEGFTALFVRRHLVDIFTYHSQRTKFLSGHQLTLA
jgi:hypothetical protein